MRSEAPPALRCHSSGDRSSRDSGTKRLALVRAGPWTAPRGVRIASRNRTTTVRHHDPHFLARLGHDRQRCRAEGRSPRDKPEGRRGQAVRTGSRAASRRIRTGPWASARGVRAGPWTAARGVRIASRNRTGTVRHHDPHHLPGLSHDEQRPGAGLGLGNVKAKWIGTRFHGLKPV